MACLPFFWLHFYNIFRIWSLINYHPLLHLGLNFHSVWLPAISSMGILIKEICIMLLFCSKTIHGLSSSLREWLLKLIRGMTGYGFPLRPGIIFHLFSLMLSQRLHWSFKSNPPCTGFQDLSLPWLSVLNALSPGIHLASSLINFKSFLKC